MLTAVLDWAISAFGQKRTFLARLVPGRMKPALAKRSVRCTRRRLTGDTGFVDFAPLDAPIHSPEFYPAMIKALRVALPVVQVAHHGGHNKFFYHALNKADYPIGDKESFLLLSHEVHGKSRPSRVFSQFMTQLGRKASHVQVLFTSQPLHSAISNYIKRIGPAAPRGSSADRGDIRLVFAENRWKIQKHSIKV